MVFRVIERASSSSTPTITMASSAPWLQPSRRDIPQGCGGRHTVVWSVPLQASHAITADSALRGGPLSPRCGPPIVEGKFLPKSLAAVVARQTAGVAAASGLSNGRGLRSKGRTFLPPVFPSMPLGHGMIPAAFSPSKGGGRIACLATNQLGGRRVLGECRDPLRPRVVEVHRYGLA